MKKPRVSPVLRVGFLVLFMLPAVGNAAEVANLYEAQVLVTGQGSAERAGPLKNALAEVVVKVTGDRGSAVHPKLALMIERAGDFVQKYHYEPLPSAGAVEGGGSAYTHRLRVSFDPQAVNGALRGAGFPVWGRVRPLTMVWLAVQESGGGRYIVGADTGADWQRPVLDGAARRGVPLVFPALDLEDQLAVSFADVWAGFQHRLAEASRRYQADAILVGRARQEEAGWRVTWSFYQGNNSDQWESGGDTRGVALAAGVEKASDLLGQRFARIFALAEDNTVSVRVDDVRTLDDYARVTRYLTSLDTVASVQVARVEPTRLWLDVVIQSSREGLRQTIALGDILVAAGERAALHADADGALTGEEMTYRLLP